MADTKIGDAANIDAVADGDEFPIADASAATAIVSATALQIKNYVLTASTFGAGTASANSWPKLTAGTLLTTPEAGALELDANCLYGTTDAGNRGVLQVAHFTRCDSAYTLTSTASEQSLFTAAQDTLTLETGVYRFKVIAGITGLSATSGNAAFDILGAGGATLGTVLYFSNCCDNSALGTPGTDQAAWTTSAQSAAAIATAGTGTALGLYIDGTFEVTAAGSIQPAITLLTAAAGSVVAGSFFECWRIGSTTATAVGQWG